MIAILPYLEAKFDYGYVMIFLHYGSKILHTKISSHFDQKSMRDGDFPQFLFPLNQENQCHAFIFAQDELEFCCVYIILEP